MKVLKNINCFIIVLLLFVVLIGCKNNDVYSYRIEDNQLVVIIDDVEYVADEIDSNNYDSSIKDAYKFYKSIYPDYIGTKEQFKEDVINNRLYYGNAELSVVYNINGVKKDEVFYRGDALTFPKVSIKDYLIEGWKYNGKSIDENYIVEEDMVIDAIVLEYVNISVEVKGSGTASLDKNRVLQGESVKLNYTADFGYKFSHIIYNGKEVYLTENDTFVVTEALQTNIVAVFEYDELSMPIMSLELEEDLVDVGKDNYVKGKMSISNTDEKYEFENLDFSFRGRGNWSWAKEKKGYRIKFDSKQNLFGNCKSKHWAIIASYTDITLLRNKMSFEMAEVLDGIYYVTSCVPLEVYINGDYRGVYSLVELPKAEKDKMNIDESYDYVDTGYIVELDAYAIIDWQKNPTNAVEGIDYFMIDGVKYPFSVKSPDPDDYVDEQMYRNQVAYIKDYFNKMFETVFEHDLEEFKKYADVDSFVDMYLLDEILKNTDVGWQSFYFVKEKGGKVYLTAPWDLELSTGINRGDQSYVGMYVSEWFDQNLDTKTASELFINLMLIPEFKALVINRFAEVKDKLIASINNTLDNGLLYEDSYNRNYEKFKLLGKKVGMENANVYNLKTWKDHVEYLRSWMINRINWLSQNLK